MSSFQPKPSPARLSRRGFFAASGAAALAASGCGDAAPDVAESHGSNPPVVPFHGQHQAGIATPSQAFLRFAAFDLQSDDAHGLQELLRAWTDLAARLTAGQAVGSTDPAKADTGEAQGLSPGRLTVTFGLGPSLFQRDGEDRLGLASRRPPQLRALPRFAGDALDTTRCGGDLAVQVCADDQQVAFHALHMLTGAARGAADPRWIQSGFRGAPVGSPQTPRNVLGFKDGTRNVSTSDRRQLDTHVWVGANDRADWMTSGTYVVTRRIRAVLDVWDALTTDGQERAIGRRKSSGAPLSGRAEHDAPDFSSQGADDSAIPATAHIRIASPEANAGARLLRRGYNYDDGVDASTGQMDAGLFFIAYARDPQRQFVAIQRKLAEHDALSEHLIHTGSAVFACPPGCSRGGFVGERLFRN